MLLYPKLYDLYQFMMEGYHRWAKLGNYNSIASGLLSESNKDRNRELRRAENSLRYIGFNTNHGGI